MADGFVSINVFPLNVLPTLLILGNHQSYVLLGLAFEEDLGLYSFLTDDSSTCVPTTLNPAGCAANLSGFFQSVILTDEDTSYENSWNLSLSYTRCSLRSRNPVVLSHFAADVLIGETTKLASALSKACI